MDTEHLGQVCLCVCATGVQGSYLPYRFLVQLPTGRASAPATTLAAHVCEVHALGASKEMQGLLAGRVVAGVTSSLSFGQRLAFQDAEQEAVGSCLPFPAGFGIKHPVSTISARGGPGPASVRTARAINMAPEPAHKVHLEILNECVRYGHDRN